MQVLELYIDNIRVDMFQDESVTITDALKDIRDIGKVFAPFSKQFNLPASSTNNKLFKHYYNFDIDNGFDARFRVDAILKLNGIDFKIGQIKLNGVGMKDNKPHTYKVVFFGKPNNLKDLFGDEELNALNSLSTYDFTYSSGAINNLRTAFISGLQSNQLAATNTANRNIVLPLILLDKYYTYDTGSTNELKNINYPDLQESLKPAIKLKRVIEAIQTQYDITFNMADEGTTKTFFGSAMFDELYLWLHREKTPITKPETDPPTFGIDIGTRGKKLTFADFTYSSGNGDVLTNNKLVVNKGESYTLRLVLDPGTTNNTGEIIVKDKTTNELLFYREDVPFNSSSNISVPLIDLTSGNLDQRTYDIEFRINCQIGLSFGALSTAMSITTSTTIHNYSASAFSLSDFVFIQDYLPKMKVLDFLTGLFKMFNLVAYTKRGSSQIYVQTFDDFMTLGTTRDITKYVDITQSTIDRPVPYNRVNFKYSNPVTQTSLRYVDQFSQVFGDLRYSAPEKYDGQEFNQEVPFERSVLINLQDHQGNQTDNVLGWWVDAEGKTTLGKPYIFFNRLIDSSSNTVTSSNLTSYNAPSNVSSLETAGVGNHTLNFGSEYDEYNGNVNTNSLFSRFYQQFIEQSFNLKGRIIKITAQLPESFILNYSVNDVIVINGKEYYLNSLSTNLTTGKSEIELIVKTLTYTNSVLA
jgi:hypothetical protein